MWKIGKVKENGKKAFKANYWKCVAVGVLSAVVLGTVGYSAGFSGYTNRWDHDDDQNNHGITEVNDDVSMDPKDLIIEVDDENADALSVTVNEDGYLIIGEDGEETEKDIDMAAMGAFAAIMLICLTVVVIIALAVSIVFDAFIYNPLEQGFNKFFLKNQDEPAEVSNIGFAFDHNYMNTVKTLFCRDLYIVLWSLLFIIPGIVKAYEYRMIPYILCDNPELSKEEAFAKSKEMMKGNKFKAFLLDLSFIGWDILSVFTFGLLSTFYVAPYKFSTRAALYKELAA